MHKEIFFTLLLLAAFFNGLGQSKYCKKNRGINYYSDWHQPHEHRSRAGVSKETIYHQRVGAKDSVLEREIYYDRNGLPTTDMFYAAPTKEGLISTIKFTYDQNGILVEKYRHYLNCVLGEVDVVTVYEYDRLNRQTFSQTDGVDANTTETIYVDDRKTIERELYPNRTRDTTRIHFYDNTGREDSMQVFRWRIWRYTTVFHYDTLKRTKETYFRYQDGTVFRSRSLHNQDGTTSSLLINNLPNWNQRRYQNVESRMIYHLDKTVKECTYFIKNKKVFTKKHFYEYY